MAVPKNRRKPNPFGKLRLASGGIFLRKHWQACLETSRKTWIAICMARRKWKRESDLCRYRLLACTPECSRFSRITCGGIGRFLCGRPIVASDLVLAETLNSLSGAHRQMRSKAANYVEDILANPEVTVESLSSESFGAALKFYAARPDKSWSMTDCAGQTHLDLES